MEKIVFKHTYANDDGFCVKILDKAPKEARTKADIIALYTVKKTPEGEIIQSYISYYTPDEAMSVAMGLLQAADSVMGDSYTDFRNKMDKEEQC